MHRQNQRNGPVTEVATDGSGYTAVVTGSSNAPPTGSLSWTVYNKDGSVLTSSASQLADADGNTITWSGTSTITYTDTLAQSAMVATYGGNQPTGGHGANPDQYYYKDSSNNSQYYTVNYSLYNVYTVFGCSSPYGDIPQGTQSYLPSSVVTPAGNYSFTYESTPSHSGYVTGRLASVTLPMGGSVSLSYGSGTGFNCTSRVIPTLQVTIIDNNGNSNTTTYANNNTSSYASPCCADFNVTVTSAPDPDNGNIQNVTVNSFNGSWLTQALSYEGAATGTPLMMTLICYNGNTSSCAAPPSGNPVGGTYGNLITQKNIYTVYNSTSYTGAKQQIVIYDCYSISPCYGNVTSVANYDFGGALLSTTNYTYGGCGTGTYVVDRPCSVTVLNSSGVQTAQTQYAYNSTGHPTQTTKWVSNSASNLTTSATYATNGALTSSTDVNNATTNYSNGPGVGACNGLMSVGSAYPVNSLTTSQTWDSNCTGAVLMSATGMDGNPWQTTYSDPLWRQTSKTDPSGQVVNISYPSPNTVTRKTPFNNSNIVHTTTLDGLGRTVVEQTYPNPSGNYDTVVTTYDVLGRIAHVTAPFSCATQGIGCSSSIQSTMTYDALGRVLTDTDENGGISTHTYYQNDELVVRTPTPTGDYSGNGKARQFEIDGLGRIKSVCEVTGMSGSSACGQVSAKNGYLTSYSYNALNQVTQVVQGTQTRTFAYDGLGRMTQESNPENGTTVYTWDGDSSDCGGSPAYPGDLNSIKRNSGLYTCFQYDLMHRMTVRFHPNNSNTDLAYFQWDSGTWNGVSVGQGGKIALAWTCSGNPVPPCGQSTSKTLELFRYDKRGNLTNYNQQSPNSAGMYGVTVNYDGVSNRNQWTIPGVPTLSVPVTAYDGEGRPTEVVASAGVSPVAPSISYGVHGPLSVEYGSGDTDNFTYDNLGHVQTYTYNIGTQSYAGTLTWNANGSLNQLKTVDGLTGGNGGTTTVNYNYDDLSRIWKASDGVNISQAFTYDRYGNVSTSGAPTSWLPTYNSASNQYQAVGVCGSSGSICYDADGNLLSDTFYNYTWNAEDKLLTTNLSSNPFVYDAFNRVVEDYSGTEYLFVPGYDTAFVNMSGQTLKGAYIPLPGGGRVIYGTSGVTSYMHPDWNGASRVTSTQAQGLYSQTEYSPFGVPYLKSNSSPLTLFDESGQEPPGEYATPNRELNATQGRWIQPDPAGIKATDLHNPQSWNRYTYVMNNPVADMDPTGLIAMFGQYDGGDPVSFSCGQEAGDGPCAATGAPDMGNTQPSYADSDQREVQAPAQGRDQDNCNGQCAFMGGQKGERGKTGRPDGTDSPFKKLKPDPNDASKVIYKDKDGKTKSKAKPEGFDAYWKDKHPDQGNSSLSKKLQGAGSTIVQVAREHPTATGAVVVGLAILTGGAATPEEAIILGTTAAAAAGP